jgi:hypothetical protein
VGTNFGLLGASLPRQDTSAFLCLEELIKKYGCTTLRTKSARSRAGNRFARDDKERVPSWGKQLPGERPRETAET